MARVLITGSSGQIGTNLFFRLRELGHEVLGIDKRENTWTSELPTEILDLTDSAQAEAFASSKLASTDIIIHLAAHAKVFELVQNPARALENITMCFHALEFARKLGAPIIFGSSREVYGDIHRIVTGEGDADFVIAESPYSASKIAGEALISSYARCYGLHYLVFRFSNVYGRYDNDLERMERVIPLFIDRIARGQRIVVFGEDKTLDFTYVDDCVGGIVLGMNHLLEEKIQDETFNLARGLGATLLELVELIAGELEVEPKLDIEPSRPGEVTYYVANIGKARTLLGYDPQVTLKEGIHRTIEWWRQTGRLAD